MLTVVSSQVSKDSCEKDRVSLMLILAILKIYVYAHQNPLGSRDRLCHGQQEQGYGHWVPTW